MAQQEGPFSEYLQQLKITPQVQAPQPTGLEGTGSAIGNIAMNFISGLRQGRQQKYMQQQMEEQRKFDAYQQAMQRVASSKLPDAEKRSLYAELETPLIRRIAGDPEATSKKTGNPLTDVIKNIASSVAGPVPKKGMELTMDPVLKALQAVSDPERQVPYLASQLDRQAEMVIRQGINAATRSGKPVTYETLFSGDAGRMLAGLENEARRLGVTLPSIARAASEYRPTAQSEWIKMQELEGQKAYFDQADPAPTPAQAPTRETRTTPAPAPAGATAAVPAVPIAAAPAVTTPAPAAAPPSVVPISESEMRGDEALAVRAGQASREFRGNIEQFKDESTGKVFSGFQYRGRRGTGIFEPGVGLHKSGVRKLTDSEVNRPSPQIVEDTYKASVKALGASVDPKIAASYTGILETLRVQGDVKGMDNVVSQALNADRMNKEYASRMAMASEAAESRRDARAQSGLQWVVSSVDKAQTVKDWNTAQTYSDGALGSVRRASSSKDYAIADLLLLRAVAKLTDLQTGIRDKEYDTFADVKGALSQLQTKYKNLLANKADRLDEKSRAEFINVLNDLKAQAAGRYNETISRFKNIGKKQGAPDDLLDIALPPLAKVITLSNKTL